MDKKEFKWKISKAQTTKLRKSAREAQGMYETLKKSGSLASILDRTLGKFIGWKDTASNRTKIMKALNVSVGEWALRNTTVFWKPSTPVRKFGVWVKFNPFFFEELDEIRKGFNK